MSALARVATPPTVGTPLETHREEPPAEHPLTQIASAIQDQEEALRNFMQGRAQHQLPRQFVFRPDSAGHERRVGFQTGMAPLVAMNAKLKQEVLELKEKCHILSIENEILKKTNAQMEALAKHNGKLKLKILELEKRLEE